MTEPTCPRNEQAVGWALHSLEPDEELAFVMHLPKCPSCRRLAGEAQEVLPHLGVAVEQVDPPASLRDRLMARVAETPQTSPSPGPVLRSGSAPAPVQAPPASPPPTASPDAVPSPPPVATPEPTDPAPPPPDPAAATPPSGTRFVAPQPLVSAPPTNPIPVTPAVPDSGCAGSRPADNRPGRGSRWSRRGRRLLAGALALVAVLAIGGLAVRNAQLQAERDAQVAQAQSLENLLDQLGRPGVRHALLATEDGSTVAAVVVENGRSQVYPLGMPANSAEHDVYVLWGIAEGAAPAALGTFDVSGAGGGLVDVGPAGNYSAYGISLESGRAAPAAPSAVMASGAAA